MITVRFSEAGDYNDWLTLWGDYLKFEGVVLDDKITACTWQRILMKDSPVLCWLAETSDEVIGFAVAVLHDG